MTPVEFHFVLPSGVPLVNSAVEIQLARSSINDDLDGVVMPRPLTLQTDFQGKATIPLWPSTTLYYVSVQDSVSEAGLTYKFLVPEVAPGMTVRLQDIVVDGAPSAVVWEDATLQLILNAKANSRASELAAGISAASAVAALQTMSAHDATILAAVDATALSAFNANVSKQAAEAAAASVQDIPFIAMGVAANAVTASTKAAEAATSAVSAAASAEAAQTGTRGTYRGLKASELDMFAITLPVIGDKVKRTDPGYEGQVFELIALPATNLDNWLAYSGGGGTDATASDYADDYADNYA